MCSKGNLPQNPVLSIVGKTKSLANLLSFSKIISFLCHIFVGLYGKIVVLWSSVWGIEQELEKELSIYQEHKYV